MRIFVLLYIFLFLASPALAYVEEDNTGLAEMSASEQNTNMYKLNASTEYQLRRLKKYDEYSGKNGGQAMPLNMDDIRDIRILEQKDFDEQQNKKLLEEVIKQTADSKVLKNNIKPDVYLSLLSLKGVKDAQIAPVLQKQLSGAGK